MEGMNISVGFAVAILSLILALGIPLFRWASKATGVLGDIQMISAKLLEMHQDPDAHDFGTRRTNELLEVSVKEHTLLLKQMVHYMRWYVQTATGKEPPPFIDLEDT